MRVETALVAAVGAILLGGCATVEIQSRRAPEADFSRLHTYQWMPETRPGTRDPRIDPEFIDRVVRAATERELDARGFMKTTSANPDFLMTYRMGVRTRVAEPASGGPHGDSPGWWGPADDVGQVREAPEGHHADEYAQGSLVLELVDPKTSRPLWSATAKTEIFLYNSAEARSNRINDVVGQMLAKLPDS